MRRVLVSVAVGATAMFLALIPIGALPSQAADTIGGFDTNGFAAPISMLVYEPAIPVPVEPQGELRYSFTAATGASGPFSTAVASSVYPGATVATGLHQFKAEDAPPPFNTLLAPPKYPIYISVGYPSDVTHDEYPKPAQPSQSGLGMVVDASATKTYGSTKTGTPPAQAKALIDFDNAASTTTVTQSPNKVDVTAVAQVDNLALLAGIIKVKEVQAESSASSDASKGAASGVISVTGVTVANQSFTVDNKGTHVGPANLPPIAGLPQGAALLKTLGISFTAPTSTNTLSGASGKNSGSGLIISIDTSPFKAALDRVPIRMLLAQVVPTSICLPPPFDPLGNQLPFGKCLHENLDALLSLSPRIDFVVGNTYGAANATPPFIVTPLDPNLGGFPPVTTTQGGTAGTPGTSGTPGLAGAEGAPAPSVAGPTNAASQFPLGFNGLKGATLLGLLVGLVSWYAIRNLGLGVIAGFAGCEYGAPRSVPDLRRG